MAKNNEAKIKFIAETGEFNEQIKNAEGSLKELRSELKLNSTQMKGAGETAELLKNRHKTLQKELEASQKKTDALSKKLETAERIFGENSEEAKKLRVQLNNAKNAEEAIKNELDGVNKKLGEQKSKFEEVGDKAGKLGEKLTSVGKGMSVISAGIVAAGTASIAAFNEVDEGADNVIKATGATGVAAEMLETAYKNVASNIVGDFGDIGSAIGEVNTRFGFAGSQLEEASTAFLKFSEVTGMDATEAVKAVSRAIESAGLDTSEYGSILDALTAAGQATGVSVDTLAQSLTDNGAIMREMGFNTQESIAMLSQFEKAGIDTSAVTRGMRTALGEWAKEGLNAEEEFGKLVKGIQDGSVTASEAYDIFGTKAGVELYDAISTGRFAYEDMIAVINSSKGSLETTFDGTVDGGYELELAMQNAKLALGEVGDTLSTTLTPIVEDITQGLKDFANWWKTLDENTQKNIITWAAVVAAIGPVLVIFGTVASSITKISTAFKALKKTLTVVKTAMTGLNLTFLASPITWIILGIVALVAAFVVLWNKCEGFRNFWKNLWKNIQNAFGAAGDWIKNKWNSVTSWLMQKVTSIKNTFATVKNAITSPFTTAINKVKGLFSALKLKFPSIKLPHFSVKPKGWKIGDLLKGSIPKLGIQWYAKGGIMTKPTVFGMNGNNAMVGGENGPEAILPINRLQDYISEAINKDVQNADLQRLAYSIDKLANRPVQLNVNGRNFATATAGDTDSVNGFRSILLERGLAL